MQNYMSNGQIPYNKGNSVQQAVNQQTAYVPPVLSQYQTPPVNPAPSYAGVNIQIINPMVNPVGGNGSIYPTQTSSAYSSAGTNGGCYPASYYTTQPGQNMYGQPVQQPVMQPSYYAPTNYPSGQPMNNGTSQQVQTQSGAVPPSSNAPSGAAGFYDSQGKYYPYVKDANGNVGYYDETGKFQSLKPVGQDNQSNSVGADGDTSVNGNKSDGTQAANDVSNSDSSGTESKENDKSSVDGVGGNSQNVDNNGKQGFTDENGKFHEYVKDNNGQLGYYDDKGVFHPVDNNQQTNAGNSSDNNSENSSSSEKITENNTTTTSQSKDGKKTEKRKVVALTNEYIKTLENYLNSQDAEVRKMGAHEVVDRLTEDPSRNDDPALTALVNKMLQDPNAGIRAIALSIVESRAILGDDLTVKILKKMQETKNDYGLDAEQATSALLKMAGKTVEKEFEVDDTQKKSATETK